MGFSAPNMTNTNGQLLRNMIETKGQSSFPSCKSYADIICSEVPHPEVSSVYYDKPQRGAHPRMRKRVHQKTCFYLQDFAAEREQECRTQCEFKGQLSYICRPFLEEQCGYAKDRVLAW